MNVIVNCFNSHSSGGLSVARKFLSAVSTLQKNESRFDRIYVICSSKSYPLLKPFYTEAIFTFITPSQVYFGPFEQLYILLFYLPRLSTSTTSSILVNLGDIPVPFCPCKQIFYFDWAFATTSWLDLLKYSGSSSFYKLLKRSLFLLALFCAQRSVLVVAQTKTQKMLLSQKYRIPLDEILVLPNTTDLLYHSFTKHHENDKKPFNIICLSGYYPHKNLEILLDVAEVLYRYGAYITIFLTFDPSQSHRASRLNDRIMRSPSSIYNVGSVPYDKLPSFLPAFDALILPSLLESFTGVFFEAFSLGLPVLASDRHFCRDLCQDSAVYFDPHSAISIADAILRLSNDPDFRTQLVSSSKDVLNSQPSWDAMVSSLFLPFFES